MRLNKSHYESYIYLLILLISSFYVVIALDLSRHWSSMIDMDIVVVYNSLLLNSGLKSEYFDQPSHTLLLINSYFYSLLDLINLIKVSNYNEITLTVTGYNTTTLVESITVGNSCPGFISGDMDGNFWKWNKTSNVWEDTGSTTI